MESTAAYLIDMKSLKSAGYTLVDRRLYHREMLSCLPRYLAINARKKSAVYSTRDTIRKSKNTQGRHPKIPRFYYVGISVFSIPVIPLEELSRSSLATPADFSNNATGIVTGKERFCISI